MPKLFRNFRLYSIIIIGVVCLFLSADLVSFAQEIPKEIKDKAIEQKTKGVINNESLTIILLDLENEGLIRNIQSSFPSYQIPNKGQTEYVTISGNINDYGKSGAVSLTITSPNNSIMELHTPVLETGSYSTILPINEQFQIGMYKVSGEFAGKELPISYFVIVNNPIEQRIPSWFLTNFLWWIKGNITDQEFIMSIQYLIDIHVINFLTKPEVEKPDMFEVVVSGQQAVRRGTTHTITTHVSDGIQGIEGARVTLTIEDYGEDIIREFAGFTNPNGDFIFSWEIPKSFDDIETLLAYISVTYGDSSRTVLFKFQVYCIDGEPGCKVEGN